MLIGRDVVPAFSVYCKNPRNSAEAQSPECSALLSHAGAERNEYI